MRVSCEAAAKWRHCRSLEPARVGWLAACLLGGRTRERKKKSPPPLLASSCVCCSAPPPPTSAPLARLLLHTGGRAAPNRALSLRTRNPLSQSGVTQEGRELPVGGAKKKKKEENDCRTTCFSQPPPPSPPLLHSALPPSRHQPRGRTPHRPLFCVSLSLSLFAEGDLCASLRTR